MKFDGLYAPADILNSFALFDALEGFLCDLIFFSPPAIYRATLKPCRISFWFPFTARRLHHRR